MIKTKIKKLSGFKKLLIVLVVLLIGINVLPSFLENALNQIKNYYYFNINPKDLVSVFENKYKNAFDLNQKILTESNQAVDDILSGKETFYVAEQKLLVNFSERDLKYKELIKIDNDSLSLKLPNSYKQFYKKRLEADKKDYEAFSVYRKGSENYFEAISNLQGFSDVYQDFLNAFGELNKDKYSQDQIDDVRYLANLFQSSYKNISGIADATDIFNQEILNYIQDEYNLYNYAKEYVDGFESKDEVRMGNASYGILSYLANKQKSDIKGIISRWSIEKFVPVYQKQDELHGDATSLYQKAYDIARKEKFKDILSAWKLNTPGYIDNYYPSI